MPFSRQPCSGLNSPILWIGVSIFLVGCRTSGDFTDHSQVRVSVHDRHIEELPPQLAAQACILTAQELASKEDCVRAIAWYEEARLRDPSLTKVDIELAHLYRKIGDRVNTESAYRRVISHSPQKSAYVKELATYFQECEDWPKATTAFRQFLAIAPNDESAWYPLGICLVEAEKYEESLVAFSKVLSLAEAQYDIGAILLRNGKTHEGRYYLEQALHTDPELIQARQILESYPLKNAPTIQKPALSQVGHTEPSLSSQEKLDR